MWSFKGKEKPDSEKAQAVDFPDWPAPGVFETICKLHENDAELRFFLPEVCFHALQATAKLNKTWVSEYVREFFVAYLYGELTLRRMRAERSGIYYRPPPEVPEGSDSGIRFSRRHRTETVPGLGKNIRPVKVFLPQRMKDDFQRAAELSNKPLSTMVREALIAHLLGNRILLERYGNWTDNEYRTAEAWEKGDIESEYIDAEESIPAESAIVQ